MKILIFFILILSTFIHASDIVTSGKIGGLYYLSGRIDQNLKIDTIDINVNAERRSFGSCKLSGDGKRKYKGKELGAVIFVEKNQYIENRSMYFVKSIVNSCEGWVKEDYFAKKLDRKDCEIEFKDENDLLKKCINLL